MKIFHFFLIIINVTKHNRIICSAWIFLVPVDLITVCGTTLQHSWYKICPSIVRESFASSKQKKRRGFYNCDERKYLTVYNEKDLDGQKA